MRDTHDNDTRDAEGLQQAAGEERPAAAVLEAPSLHEAQHETLEQIFTRVAREASAAQQEDTSAGTCLACELRPCDGNEELPEGFRGNYCAPCALNLQAGTCVECESRPESTRLPTFGRCNDCLGRCEACLGDTLHALDCPSVAAASRHTAPDEISDETLAGMERDGGGQPIRRTVHYVDVCQRCGKRRVLGVDVFCSPCSGDLVAAGEAAERGYGPVVRQDAPSILEEAARGFSLLALTLFGGSLAVRGVRALVRRSQERQRAAVVEVLP